MAHHARREKIYRIHEEFATLVKRDIWLYGNSQVLDKSPTEDSNRKEEHPDPSDSRRIDDLLLVHGSIRSNCGFF